MKHGTRSYFVNQKCRCLPCRSANAKYQARRINAVRQGQWTGNHSAAKVRAMIRKLITEGFTLKSIARRTGRTQIIIRRNIQPKTARAIEGLYNAIMAE